MMKTSFHQAYGSLLTELQHAGTEMNKRTGVLVKRLDGAHSFKLDLKDGKLPLAGNRRYYPRVAAVETAWELMGTQDPTFVLQRAPKIWSDFTEEDGKIKCAYGYRWRVGFGRDQIRMALDALRKDPSNRQVYVSAWDPSHDGLGAPDQPKNIPCPVGFSLTKTDDRLHLTLFMRSSDVFVGLPYDVMGYALKLDAFAAELECTPGTLHVTLAHPHIYEPHFEMLTKSLDLNGPVPQPSLPGWTVGQITQDPDGYVDVVKRLANRVRTGEEWNAMPELVVVA
jgi:thymidylate synthase